MAAVTHDTHLEEIVGTLLENRTRIRRGQCDCPLIAPLNNPAKCWSIFKGTIRVNHRNFLNNVLIKCDKTEVKVAHSNVLIKRDSDSAQVQWFGVNLTICTSPFV